MKKPKEIYLYDGRAECRSESLIFNEAFGVEIDCFIYDSNGVKKLMKFLEKALLWIEHKEKYLGRGIK